VAKVIDEVEKRPRFGVPERTEIENYYRISLEGRGRSPWDAATDLVRRCHRLAWSGGLPAGAFELIVRQFTKVKPWRLELAPGAYYVMAALYLRSQDTANAKKVLREALGAFPEDPNLLLLHANVLGDLREYAASAAIYRRLLRRTKNDPVLLANYGGCLVALHKFQEAEHLLDRALKIDKKCAAAHYNKASSRFLQGKLEEALDIVDRAIAFVGSDVHLHVQKSWVLLAQGSVHQAMEEAQRATRIEPKSYDAWLSQAHALETLGRYGEARIAYETCQDFAKSETEREAAATLLRSLSKKEAAAKDQIHIKSYPVDSIKRLVGSIAVGGDALEDADSIYE
jgi:tetratricopeptide (TPR) repeat protein